jgi:hypothetical protein
MLKKIIACTTIATLLFSTVSYADDIHYESNSTRVIGSENENTICADDEMIFVNYAKEEDTEVDEVVIEPEVEEESEETDLEVLYGKENILKVQITCYIEAGKPTCTGSYRMEGVAAGRREWLGCTGLLYRVNPDGTLGEFFDMVEFNDIGYGAPVGFGTKSDLFKNRSAGTIETGKTIDIRRPNMAACKDYMRSTYTGGGTTGSEVYMQLIKGDG